MPELKALDLSELRVELDRRGATWRSVDTNVAMLTERDRRVRLGVPLPAEPEVQRILQRSEAVAGTAPASTIARGPEAGVALSPVFDARNVDGGNYVTDVRDQGGCGSCVSFGTVATLETTAAFRRRQPELELDLSEQQLFFIHGQASGASCQNGWMPVHAFTACRDIGVTFEDYLPYQAGGGGTINADWPNRLARITGFQDLTGDVARMKQHLADRGALSACFIVYQDFFSYGGGVYRHVSGTQAGGHCVCLVGYDDQQGCWIAKNSWATGWGEQGFFRIAYGECGIETWSVHGADDVHLRMWVDALVRGLFSNESPDNAYAYLDKLGWTRLAYGAEGANLSMLSELASARLRNKAIHAYHYDGQLTQTYVF